jgi:hypothetical protein
VDRHDDNDECNQRGDQLGAEFHEFAATKVAIVIPPSRLREAESMYDKQCVCHNRARPAVQPALQITAARCHLQHSTNWIKQEFPKFCQDTRLGALSDFPIVLATSLEAKRPALTGILRSRRFPSAGTGVA